MVFYRKSLMPKFYEVKLQASVLQVYHNRTPPWIFSTEFIPGHLLTADSILLLMK